MSSGCRNVQELVTVQQSSIISGSMVLFLSLGVTTYLPTYFGKRNRTIFIPKGAPYKRTYLFTYLLTYLLGNRTMVLGFIS